MANGSMYNLDNIRKAAKTYNTTAPAPSKATTAAQNVMNNWNKPPQVTGAIMPPVAMQAANNVRNGVSSVPSAPSAATAAAQRMVSATSQPRTETALNNVSNLVSTPFSYDAGNDQALQAAIRNAQAQLAVNQKNTNAQLRATGQGKSSYSETVANQLANQTSEAIANDLVPQYAKMAYQQYQDSIANNRNLYQDYYQQDVTTPMNEAQITGNYLPEEAKMAIQNILGLKQQAEQTGITRDQRAALSGQADQLRAKLQSLGIDPSLYGANVNSAKAAQINPGIRTLAGQAQDQSVKNANLDAATAVSNMTGRVITPQTDWQGLVRQANNPNTPLNANQQNMQFNQQYQLEQFAYSKARDAIADKQWQTKFDEDVRQNGLSYGLQQLAQQNDQAYRQAQLALSQDDNARQWVALDYDQSRTGSAKSGFTPNQVLDNVKSLYSEPIYSGTKFDENGNEVPNDTGKTKITTDPAKRKEMFEAVIDYGLSDAETNQILLSLGMNKKEIDSLLKSYSGN